MRWTSVELREECRDALAQLVGPSQVVIGNFLELPRPDKRYDVALFNPSLTHAMEFVREAMERSTIVAALVHGRRDG